MAEATGRLEVPARATVEARLEDAVRGNRFTIAVIFPLVGAVTLLASAGGALPAPLSYNPLLLLAGTAVMRSPLVVALLARVDRRALGCLGALSAYTYAIELVGVRTGWPYGDFEYAVGLGPMLFEAVPLALPLFFVPLVANAYLLTLLLLGDRAVSPFLRIPTAVLAVLAIDLVLDPAAVAVGFWEYRPPGPYYGVPLSNYLGWTLSATVAVALLDLGFDRAGLRERLRACEFALDDAVSFVLLWGAINLWVANWLAVAVAGALWAALVHTGRYDPTRLLPPRPSRR